MKNNKHIVDYLRGNRRGREANRMEREAMQDPFLSKALEGYDKHAGNHANDILRLQHEVALSAHRRKNSAWWAAAACIVALIGISTFFYTRPATEQLSPAPLIAMKVDSLIQVVDTDQVVQLLAAKEESKRSQEKKQPKPAISMDEQVAPPIEVDAKIMAEVAVRAEMPVALNDERKDKNKELEDVVVLGYARQKQASLVGKVSAVSEQKENLIAQPEIGEAAYLKYIEDNIRHPNDSICGNNLIGRVTLRFYVDTAGRPYAIEVVQSLCKSYDDEAIRLIKEGSNFLHSAEPVEYSVEFKD